MYTPGTRSDPYPRPDPDSKGSCPGPTDPKTPLKKKRGLTTHTDDVQAVAATSSRTAVFCASATHHHLRERNSKLIMATFSLFETFLME